MLRLICSCCFSVTMCAIIRHFLYNYDTISFAIGVAALIFVIIFNEIYDFYERTK
jgi:hypothetical protein